jgi:predicted patatin/cPLA2 family phospholipase
VGGATVAAMEHPVAQVLAERVRTGSRAGERADGHRVALVLEGGGMRGVVSAAMTGALERLGLTPCFDLVVGSSAGAINGAALLAGSAQQASAAYCGPLASRSFVNPLRILRGKPVIDVNDVRALAGGLDPHGHERVVDGPIALHCVAVDVDSARTVDLHGMRTQRELWDAILASSRMPWAGGPAIEIGGRRYLDGGMGAPIPVAEALAAGATHVLALQTRPHGVPRKSASRIGDRLIERHLGRLNPALVQLYRDRIAAYELLVADIARRSADASAGPPHVLGVRPAEGTPCVGQLERRPAILGAAAADAERLVERLLSAGALRPVNAG